MSFFNNLELEEVLCKEVKKWALRESLGSSEIPVGGSDRGKRLKMTRTGCSKHRRAGTLACFEDYVAKEKVLERWTKAAYNTYANGTAKFKKVFFKYMALTKQPKFSRSAAVGKKEKEV